MISTFQALGNGSRYRKERDSLHQRIAIVGETGLLFVWILADIGIIVVRYFKSVNRYNRTHATIMIFVTLISIILIVINLTNGRK